jgi:hypothetical protein
MMASLVLRMCGSRAFPEPRSFYCTLFLSSVVFNMEQTASSLIAHRSEWRLVQRVVVAIEQVKRLETDSVQQFGQFAFRCLEGISVWAVCDTDRGELLRRPRARSWCG